MEQKAENKKISGLIPTNYKQKELYEESRKLGAGSLSLTRWYRDSMKIKKNRNEKGYITKKLRKFKKSSDPTTKAQHNWKIWMKWAIFQTDTKCQS